MAAAAAAADVGGGGDGSARSRLCKRRRTCSCIIVQHNLTTMTTRVFGVWTLDSGPRRPHYTSPPNSTMLVKRRRPVNKTSHNFKVYYYDAVLAVASLPSKTV